MYTSIFYGTGSVRSSETACSGAQWRKLSDCGNHSSYFGSCVPSLCAELGQPCPRSFSEGGCHIPIRGAAAVRARDGGLDGRTPPRLLPRLLPPPPTPAEERARQPRPQSSFTRPSPWVSRWALAPGSPVELLQVQQLLPWCRGRPFLRLSLRRRLRGRGGRGNRARCWRGHLGLAVALGAAFLGEGR